MHSEIPVFCCQITILLLRQPWHGAMDRGHARRLLFPLLIRLFLLVAGGTSEPSRRHPARAVLVSCGHGISLRCRWGYLPTASVFCLLAAEAGRRGVGVAVGTAGRARQAVLGCSPAKLAHGVPLHATRWRGRRQFRSPLESDADAAMPMRRKGPGRRFDSFTDHMVRHQMPAEEDVPPILAEAAGAEHGSRNVAYTECREIASGVGSQARTGRQQQPTQKTLTVTGVPLGILDAACGASGSARARRPIHF